MARPATELTVALALAGVFLSGCAAFTTMCRGTGPAPATRPVPVAGTPWFDWKGVLHCHSHFSHDSEGTLAEIADAARVAGLDFLVMTDHQTDAAIAEGTRGMAGDTLFLVGAEVRTPQGTILAFPLIRPLRRWQSAPALVAEARAQGALAFLGHAEATRAWEVPGIAGVEIVNLHAGATAASRAGLLLGGLFLPLRSLMEQTCQRDAELFANWDRAALRRHPLTAIGGNDAHANIRLLGPLGLTVANYREVFLTLSTHVLAERLDEAALVAAFAAGRTYACFDVFGEGWGFDYRAIRGEQVFPPGASVPASADLRLEVRAPADARLRLLRDGRLVREQAGRTLAEAGPAPGVYRVEVWTRHGTPWIFSSAIRIEPRAPGAVAPAGTGP